MQVSSLSCDAGAGRAGKLGCLAGSKGSMYKGQVLAGRPHGKGQYWAPVSCSRAVFATSTQCWQVFLLVSTPAVGTVVASSVAHPMCASCSCMGASASSAHRGCCTDHCVVPTDHCMLWLHAQHLLLCAQAVRPGGAMRLVYEGDFRKGVREGQGTSYEHSGEVYTGSWQQNKRTGPGALTCASTHTSSTECLQWCSCRC
jgi:hypothetical protein